MKTRDHGKEAGNEQGETGSRRTQVREETNGGWDIYIYINKDKESERSKESDRERKSQTQKERERERERQIEEGDSPLSIEREHTSPLY